MTPIDATPETGADVPPQTRRKTAETFHRKTENQLVTPMPNDLKDRVARMARDHSVSRATISRSALEAYLTASGY